MSSLRLEEEGEKSIKGEKQKKKEGKVILRGGADSNVMILHSYF